MKTKSRTIDLTGQRFGRLTVIELDPTKETRHTYWICECDCGNIKSARADSLKKGAIKSCGCMKKEQDRINLTKHHSHKMSDTRIYNEWQGMLDRCFNRNNNRWARYGGRGITVCDDWKSDFQSFYKWAIANGYQDDLTIDRIDNDGDYCPDNCRWATCKEQARNRSTNIDITIGNSTRTLMEWCEIFQLNYKAIYRRYKRNGNCGLEDLFNSGYNR